MSATVTAQPLPAPMPATPGAADVPRPWLAQVLLDTVGRTGARVGLAWIFAVGFFAVFAPFVANSHPYFLRTTEPLLVRQYGAVSSPLLRHLDGVDVTLPILAVAALVLWLSGRGLATRHKFLIFTAVLLSVAALAHWRPLASWFGEVFQSMGKSGSRAWSLGKMVAVGFMLAIDAGLVVWIFLGSSIPGRVKVITSGVLVLLAVLLVVFPVDPPLLSNYSQYREAEAAGQVQSVVRAPVPYSPVDRLRDQFTADRPHPWPPGREHWLGTEGYGSDILSRMIHACRIAMAVGFIATGIAVVIGSVVGGVMGYFVGWIDLIGMRVVEIFNSIPTLYLLLAFVAFFGRNLYMMMVIIGLTTWVGDARFVRAEFLRIRNQDFVHAARAAGLPLGSILFRHMLPNAMAPLLVSASFGVAWAILYESTLSFLGLGLIDEPSWGSMLNQATGAAGNFYWWLATFPGLAIFLTVFAYNLIGEAVRDALDPKLKNT